jgi:protein-tyrosine phosphatase
MINQITKKIALSEAVDVTEENLKRWNVNDTELPLERKGMEPEPLLCRRLGIEYVYRPCAEAVKTMAQFIEDLKQSACCLENLVKKHQRVLVHCLSGIDRAPLVIAYYLSNVAYLTIPQAYRLIKQQRKCVMEHYEWVE